MATSSTPDSGYIPTNLPQDGPTSFIEAADVTTDIQGLTDRFNAHTHTTNTDIADNAITTAKILDDAVTAPKISNPYKASAYKSVAQNSIAVNTWTQVTLGTENYDPNSNFATNAYTVPVTGWYQVNAQVYWTYSKGVEASFAVGIGINATDTPTYAGYENTGGMASYLTAVPTVNRILYLTAGQTITLWGWHGASSGTNNMGISVNTYLDIHLLST